MNRKEESEKGKIAYLILNKDFNVQLPKKENAYITTAKGVGKALLSGLTFLSQHYDFIITMDGDGKHTYPNVESIKLNQNTLYIFCRNNNPRLISRLGNWLINKKLHLNGIDVTHGLKIYPKALIPYLKLNIINNSFAWQIYAVKTALKHGFKVECLNANGYYFPQKNEKFHLMQVILSLIEVILP